MIGGNHRWYNLPMQTVPIDDLIAHVAEYLALVRQGETISVTDDGHCVATVAPAEDHPPIEDESPLDRVRRRLNMRPAQGDLLDIEPLPAIPGEKPLSQQLIEERYLDWR